MTNAFKIDVERFKQELLKQVQPGTGMIDVSLGTNASEAEEMAAGEAVVAVAVMLQRPITLHFLGEEQLVEEREEERQYVLLGVLYLALPARLRGASRLRCIGDVGNG